jgi:hypothetical protein
MGKARIPPFPEQVMGIGRAPFFKGQNRETEFACCYRDSVVFDASCAMVLAGS